MLNKRRIFAIALFVVAALFTYAFANPSQKQADEKTPTDDKADVTEDVTDTPVVEGTPVVIPVTQNQALVQNALVVVDLTTNKNSAKDELRIYADSKLLKEEYKVELEKIVSDGNTNIDNATSIEAISNALNDAKKLVDELVIKADLKQYKDSLILELNTYYNSKNFIDKDSNPSASKLILETGIKNINDSNTKADSLVAFNIAKAGLDLLEEKQKLEKAKLEAISELNNYYDSLDFLDKADLESTSRELLSNLIGNINAVTKIDNISNLLVESKLQLDELNTNQRLERAKVEAISELNNYYDSLDFLDKADLESTSRELLSNLISNINAVTKIDDISNILSQSKLQLDELNTKQRLERAKVIAISELKQYKISLEFTSEFLTRVGGANTIETNGINSINSSTTILGVNEELNRSKALLDSLKEELMKPATITLNGNSTIILTRGTSCSYSDAGVSVVSNSGYTTRITTTFNKPYGGISTVTNGINVDCKVSLIPFHIAEAGTYTIKYEITNIYGRVSEITRTVKVGRFSDKIFSDKDLEISFNNSNDTYNVCATSNCSEPSIDLSGEAYDYVDGKFFGRTNITSNLVINGTVDTTKIGDNQITYVATDWLGNTKTETRIIKIRDLSAPTINFGALGNVQYQGLNVLIPTSITTDNYDLNPAIEMIYNTSSEKYDYSKTPNYIKWGIKFGYNVIEHTKTLLTSVTYKATDSSGNVSYKTYTLPTPLLISDIESSRYWTLT